MKQYFCVFSTFVLLFLLASCGPINIDDVEGEIAEVINGNTFKLNTETIVHLRGVKSSNTMTKEMLDKMIGKEVSLVTDDKDDEKTIDSYDEEVWVYATLSETSEDLGLLLLQAAGCDALDASNVEDYHRDDYMKVCENVCSGPLDTKSLSARLKASSMLVFGSDGSKVWNGTAFFIGKDGLALTNNHVLNYQTGNVVVLSDANGNMDINQKYKIKRVVYADEDYDYAIFYVDLDPNTEKTLTYLNITREKEIPDGTEICTVGNPTPSGNKLLNMTFSSGVISRYDHEFEMFQVSVDITHGFSGSAVVNNGGCVIGIAQGGYETREGIASKANFAVDIRKVRAKLDELNIPYGGR